MKNKKYFFFVINRFFLTQVDKLLNAPRISYTGDEGQLDGIRGLVVSMLASGIRVRGFKPGRRRIPSFGGEVKESACMLLRHVKEPSTSVNYDVLAKFLV